MLLELFVKFLWIYPYLTAEKLRWQLVYARAFGDADSAATEATRPDHMMRIASVSKSITAIAVMKLIEDNQLELSDIVFGSNGILDYTYY